MLGELFETSFVPAVSIAWAKTERDSARGQSWSTVHNGTTLCNHSATKERKNEEAECTAHVVFWVGFLF
jgi:hypothetical protein